MSLKAFIADGVLTGGQFFKDRAVLCEAGRVKGLVAKTDIPSNAQKVDLAGLTLAAGLVDAQVNGGGGVLFNDEPTTTGIEKITRAHQRCGTTALLPTLITDGAEKLTAAVHAVRQFRQSHGGDAGVLGLHLEGPFLNPERSGIHEKGFIQKADAGFLKKDDIANLGTLLITLAPEMVATGIIRSLTQQGAIVAAGHSAANSAQISAAKAEGLTGITHLFNAMGPMSAREPGLSGLALQDGALSCSIIADGAHVAPEMLRLAVHAKPDEKLFLVSDAMPPAGAPQMKEFTLQGKQIYVKDGKCVDAEGHLAGSAFTLFECLRYAVKAAGLTLEKGHAMASFYPARFLQQENSVGSLEPGARADIIAFDNALKLEKVFIGAAILES